MYTIVGKNRMLDALGVTHVSAHSADPLEAGANELPLGGAYARQPIDYAASAGGNLSSSNIPVISFDAANVVGYLGYWDALTGGTFLGSSQITEETFANAGTLTLNNSDLDLNLEL